MNLVVTGFVFSSYTIYIYILYSPRLFKIHKRQTRHHEEPTEEDLTISKTTISQPDLHHRKERRYPHPF